MAKITTLILLTILAFACAEIQNVKKEPLYPSDILNAWKKAVEPFVTECMCQSKVDPIFIENFKNYGELTNDACFKCFAKCIGLKMHTLKENGDIDVGVVTKLVAGATEEIAKDCLNTVTYYKDICEKFYVYSTCVAEKVRLQKSN